MKEHEDKYFEDTNQLMKAIDVENAKYRDMIKKYDELNERKKESENGLKEQMKD